jgi:signal transduction histidine kinase
MKSLLHKRFQLQLLFALIAAISVAALTIELMVNAVRHAESFVLSDTDRSLAHALQDLVREYRLRRHADATWGELPTAAQDLTLRGISQTVLASYPGVEGGFFISANFLGYSYPTHDGASPKTDVPAAERATIEAVIAQARQTNKSERVLRGKHDLVVIAAVSDGTSAAWAMKRLPGEAEPQQRTQNILLAALVGAAFLGAAGVLATGIGLHRGVAQIKSGLASLNKNFTRGLPVRRDELGEISAAINEMASARRRLEEEVRREDRARTIGRLVGRIAHEMRNPLNSIRLSLQMLANRQEEKRLQPGDFQMVIDEVDRMNRLLSDLLSFQQPRPPKMERRVVGPILAECIQLVRHQGEKQGVDLVIGGQLTQATLVDEHYFRQIMVNLILNAIDVSKSGQRVDIAAGTLDGRVAIEVSDSGPGLTAEQQEHLFEPFYTTKTTGHGLGLAVSRELAQTMGANVSYKSGPVYGTTFVLQLKGIDD